jgi:hypothetical protein
MTPGHKAQHTAKWARTMTKWLITFNRRKGVKWNLVEFGGKTKSEARGIVDILAIRKNHRTDVPGLKRGDLFDIVLIQTKGGSASRPIDDDIARLTRVARHYKARDVVLAEWNKGTKPVFYRLVRRKWETLTPSEIFD